MKINRIHSFILAAILAHWPGLLARATATLRIWSTAASKTRSEATNSITEITATGSPRLDR